MSAQHSTDSGPPMRVIAGSGRSGTTWVLDCLADANQLRPIFEPLHPKVTPLGPAYAHRAIAPGDSHPELLEYLRRVDSGAYRSMWVNYRGRRDLLFPGPQALLSLRQLRRLRRRWVRFLGDLPGLRRRSARQGALIKVIRGNLALGWMVASLPARAVLIVRHPCAVVESQYRLGEIWHPSPILERFRGDQLLDARTQGRYRDLLKAKLSTIEALTLVWAIENQLPVAEAGEYGYEVIHYENMRRTPQSEWRRIAQALDLSQVPAPQIVQAPSQQASRRLDDPDADSTRPRWARALKDEDLARIQRLLDTVGCELYGVENELPVSIAAGAPRSSAAQ